MRAGLALLLCAALSCCGAPEQAADQSALAERLAEVDACGYEGCRGPFYPVDDLEFGAPLIGASISAPPTDAEETSCGDRDFAQLTGTICSYRRGGVIYLLNSGRLTNKQVMLSQVPSSSLPYGLRGDETPEQVVAQLESVTHLSMWIDPVPGSIRIVRNAGTMRNALGAPVWLFVVFDEDDHMIFVELLDPSIPAD